MVSPDLEQTVRRADDAVRNGRYAEALQILRRLGDGNPLMLATAASVAWAMFDKLKRAHGWEGVGIQLNLLEQAYAQLPAWQLLYNLGTGYKILGDHASAAVAYGQALQEAPEHVASWAELGACWAALGRVEEARLCYERAAELPVNEPMDRLARSWAQLAIGHADAWRTHEARLLVPSLNLTPTIPAGVEPWDGVTWPGRLLLFAEQGVGDAVQMLRYVPRLCGDGVAVALAVPASLQRLVATMGYGDLLLKEGDPWPEGLTHYASLMSLPALVGVPDAGPAYIPGWVGQRPVRRVAIAWAGSPVHRNDATRSSPLAAWRDLLSLPLEWIAIGQDVRDNTLLEAGVPQTVTVASGLHDYEETRKVLAGVDVVVSVDTSLAHLAGAMGIPTLVLLAADADQRWGLVGDRTPWYDSWTLLRQPRAHAWVPVLADARTRLEELARA